MVKSPPDSFRHLSIPATSSSNHLSPRHLPFIGPSNPTVDFNPTANLQYSRLFHVINHVRYRGTIALRSGHLIVVSAISRISRWLFRCNIWDLHHSLFKTT
ncbi:hypothetical protein RDI58_012358 [Solanum bulbocastanum]|uniref:Uncharacterized protein n=1 Tax=Solanum bulbocastanum TaxID=147425 RepID=A0AAN8YD09_SOLBU